VGDKWLVTAGLAAGDKVVTEGRERIKPGETVRPVPAGAPQSLKPRDDKGGGGQGRRP
jgi:membrane fusion protein (multidrug efflux system)